MEDSGERESRECGEIDGGRRNRIREREREERVTRNRCRGKRIEGEMREREA